MRSNKKKQSKSRKRQYSNKKSRKRQYSNKKSRKRTLSASPMNGGGVGWSRCFDCARGVSIRDQFRAPAPFEQAKASSAIFYSSPPEPTPRTNYLVKHNKFASDVLAQAEALAEQQRREKVRRHQQYALLHRPLISRTFHSLEDLEKHAAAGPR